MSDLGEIWEDDPTSYARVSTTQARPGVEDAVQDQAPASFSIPRPARSALSAQQPRTPLQVPPERSPFFIATLPTEAQCLTHLKLLECFDQLRETIAGGECPGGPAGDLFFPRLDDASTDELVARMSEKRWQIYVTKACLRFQAYWRRTLGIDSTMLVEENVEDERFADLATHSRPLEFTADTLPPLDILMVYHAFLLSPRNFFSDCVRYGKMAVWAAGMPWSAIDSAISVQTNSDGSPGKISYMPNARARANFKRQTRLQWLSLAEGSVVPLRCPRCSRPLDVPMSTVIMIKEVWLANADVGENGEGFADRNLSRFCACGLRLTHELMRMQKLRDDVRGLCIAGVPMPGTFLTLSHGGLPASAVKSAPGEGTYPAMFPNRLLKAGLGKQIARLCSPRRVELATMQDVLDLIKTSLEDTSLLARAGHGSRANHSRPMALKECRLAFRRMMSSYLDNSSIFNMDLVGAVIRQTDFTRKMANLAWHRSLASPDASMRRFISKYANFFTLLSHYPDRAVVPTIDVDLVWHTHQTTPQTYLAYSLRRTDVFINHDDRVEEDKLSDGFEWTCKTYQQTFGQVYSECLCWYCEAVRELTLPPAVLDESGKSSISSGLRKILTGKSRHGRSVSTVTVQEDLAQSLSSLYIIPPMTSPDTISTITASTEMISSRQRQSTAQHLSVHRVLRSPYEDPNTYLSAINRARDLDRAYEIACQRAEKARRPKPHRPPFEIFEPWSGIQYRAKAGWAPYMEDPCLNAGFYVSPPSCLADSRGSCIPLGTMRRVGAKGIAVAGDCASDLSGCVGDGGMGGCAGGDWEGHYDAPPGLGRFSGAGGGS